MKSTNGNVHPLEILKNSNIITHTDDSRFEMTTPTGLQCYAQYHQQQDLGQWPSRANFDITKLASISWRVPKMVLWVPESKF